MTETKIQEPVTNTSLDDVTAKGEYKRKDAVFRNWISSEEGAEFPPESGRYHVYVCLACPWASRVLFVRKLFGLEDVISVDVVAPVFGETGWVFQDDMNYDGVTGDSINGYKTFKEFYLAMDPEYDGRYTVPVLFDKKTNKIVSNESSEIIRMINDEFRPFFTRNEKVDIYPESLREAIDELNEWVYPSINNGVYRSGFATSQEAYSNAVTELFDALDRAEELLSKNRYLTGDYLTEADIRLFVTIVRFDPVYVTHFKCNKKRIVDYPNLNNHLREIYQLEGISETVVMKHIKDHYFISHKKINPYGIVPEGPTGIFENLTAEHDRSNLGKQAEPLWFERE